MIDIYKWIWSYTPLKRPFTYWLRDLWHKFESIWIIGLIAIGVSMGHHYDWIMVLKILGVFTIGFIIGHLFWGKDYIPDEKGE